MDESTNCTFCRQDAEPNSQWEIPWFLQCADSLQKLLDLDPFTLSFFESAAFCRSCKNLVRDVDFMSRTVSALERRLAKSRQEIAKMLLDNFEECIPTYQATCRDKDQFYLETTQDGDIATGAATSVHQADSDLSSPSPASMTFLKDEEDIVQVNSPPHYEGDNIKTEQDTEHQMLIAHTSTADALSEPERQEAYVRPPESAHAHLVSSSVGCLSSADGTNEFNQDSQLIDDEAVALAAGNGPEDAEFSFCCSFPGCTEKFGSIYRLDSHNSTHLGWRPFTCTVPSCKATFIRSHHLTRHTTRVHKTVAAIKKTSASMTTHRREEANDSDSPTPAPPTQQPPAVTHENADSRPETENCGRRSVRIASRPQKRCSPSGEEEIGDEDADSDFRVSTEEDSDAEEEFEVAAGVSNNLNEVAIPLPKETGGADTVLSRKLGPGRPKKFRCQNEGLIPWSLRKYPNVCAEVGEEVTAIGHFPSWETLIPSPSAAGIDDRSHLPPDTFEATFVFLFEKARKDGPTNAQRPYECAVPHCHRRFNSSSGSNYHARAAHGQLLDSFQCFICDKRAPSALRLDTHFSKVHGGETHPFQCPVPLCPSQYVFHNKLKHHMATQHPEFPFTGESGRRMLSSRGQRKRKGIKSALYCDQDGCNYKTMHAKYLRGHRIQAHGQEDQGLVPYECETCGAGFENQRHYTDHRRLKHKDTKSICEFCGKRFVRRDLRAHIRWKHFDVANKYNCKVCTRLYFNAEDCAAHEERHAKVPPFFCILSCGQKMRQCGSAEELVKHVQGYHDDAKKLVCDICGYTASGCAANQHLQTHMNVHAKEKIYKCKYCEKTFRGSSETLFHTQVHHQDQVKKEYKCEGCGQVFNVYLYYYRHRKSKHGVMPRFKRKRVSYS